jgi:hypothetical protein
MSDEPAMHDEALNSRSFAKRGEQYSYVTFALLI